MSRNRTQHRPTRESPAKEVAQLKQENKQLKRKVAALRKQVEQIEEAVVLQADEPVDEERLWKWRCPGCGDPRLGLFVTPSGKEIRYCMRCKTQYDNVAA